MGCSLDVCTEYGVLRTPYVPHVSALKFDLPGGFRAPGGVWVAGVGSLSTE